MRVVDMFTIDAIDENEIRAAASETSGILTVKEHNITGGLGTAVGEVLLDLQRISFKKHDVPYQYVEVGPPTVLYAYYKLDAPGIVEVVQDFLKTKV